MKKILLFTSLFCISFSNFAQLSFQHYDKAKALLSVTQNNKTIKLPFAGGFNVPQFVECDLNYDGIKDLIVFDRDGYRLSTFINKGIQNTISYEYAPQYEAAFPKITDWIFTIDYNGDGKLDLFTSMPGGAKIYKNTGNSTIGLQFTQTYSELLADYGNFVTRLNINGSDYPAIADIDDDGDIDILTFYPAIDTSGESVYLYKNMSKERYNKTDSMDFIVGKLCWGRFRESFTDCNIHLNYPIGPCGSGGRFVPSFTKEELNNLQKSTGPAHAGSTLLVLDANADGLKDMLIGDITCTKMYLLTNGTNNQEPIMTTAYKGYPINHPIEINTFPTAFLMDVNNDGKKDLIAAANILSNSDNTENVQLYLNNGSNDINQFTFESNAFLENEMIDVGMGSSPAFVDYNADGKLDIVISNTGYYDTVGVYTTGLALYENVGVDTLPAYNLITRDWLGFSTLNIANMAPDFSDLDNDGDVDMICGSSDGTLHYFQNSAGPNNTLSLQYVPNYFAGIDLGNMSTPFVYDLNNDGKKEIIVAERFDNLNLIENTGTLVNPTYIIKTDSLWKVNTRAMFGYPSGRNKAVIAKLTNNEQARLMLSVGNGKVYIMNEVNEDITVANNMPFDSITTSTGLFSNSNGGFNLAVADIDKDAKLDLLVGNPQGGLILFKNTSVVTGVGNNPSPSASINLEVYPNPSTSAFNILSSNGTLNELNVMGLNGQLLKSIKLNSSNYTLTMDEFQSGMYILECILNEGTKHIKIVKQ